MSDPIQISVVVCSYNRADLLSVALQTLCDQTLDPSRYEIIVVDNNCVDNTRGVVEEFCERHSNVRYCREREQGLSHARNRGWKEARGKYVGYIDDDCKVPEEWLGVAKDVIERIAPAAFGGPFYAFYNTHKPRWYRDSYGSHEPGIEARVLDRRECVKIYGGNAFFRRTVLENLGGFDPSFGMSGEGMAYGEETVVLRLISATMPGQLIYYEPRLYVYHLVNPKKMRMRWIVRAAFAHGRYSYRVFNHDAPRGRGRRQLLGQTLWTSLALALDVARSMLLRDRKQYCYVQNYLYEHARIHVHRLGILYEQSRQTGQHP